MLFDSPVPCTCKVRPAPPLYRTRSRNVEKAEQTAKGIGAAFARYLRREANGRRAGCAKGHDLEQHNRHCRER